MSKRDSTPALDLVTANITGPRPGSYVYFVTEDAAVRRGKVTCLSWQALADRAATTRAVIVGTDEEGLELCWTVDADNVFATAEAACAFAFGDES